MKVLCGRYGKGQLLLIQIGCAACFTVALLVWPREPEPEYNRVPLSVWLKGYGNPRMTYSADSMGALYRSASATRQIGTNALPFLLRWIQYERPGWRKSFDRLAWKLPPGLLNTRAGRWLVADRAHDRAWSAVAGFAFLGTNATPALPELKRLVKDSSNGWRQYRAEVAIKVIVANIPIPELEDVRER